MQFQSLRRVEKLKKTLEILAFASLFFDACVSIVTLLSLQVGRSSTTGILYVLGYALTAIVALSVIAFIGLVIFSGPKIIINAFSRKKFRRQKR